MQLDIDIYKINRTDEALVSKRVVSGNPGTYMKYWLAGGEGAGAGRRLEL